MSKCATSTWQRTRHSNRWWNCTQQIEMTWTRKMGKNEEKNATVIPNHSPANVCDIFCCCRFTIQSFIQNATHVGIHLVVADTQDTITHTANKTTLCFIFTAQTNVLNTNRFTQTRSHAQTYRHHRRAPQRKVWRVCVCARGAQRRRWPARYARRFQLFFHFTGVFEIAFSFMIVLRTSAFAAMGRSTAATVAINSHAVVVPNQLIETIESRLSTAAIFRSATKTKSKDGENAFANDCLILSRTIDYVDTLSAPHSLNKWNWFSSLCGKCERWQQ